MGQAEGLQGRLEAAYTLADQDSDREGIGYVSSPDVKNRYRFSPDGKCVYLELTQGKEAIIDTEDLPLVGGYRWHIREVKKRHTTSFYARAWVVGSGRGMKSGKKVSLHALVGGKGWDHINRDGLDNRKENLRPATPSQQNSNRRLGGNSTTGYRGVSFHKRVRRFQAMIQVKGKNKFLGLFSSPQEAALAYDRAAMEYFGQFAFLNFPDKEPTSDSGLTGPLGSCLCTSR